MKTNVRNISDKRYMLPLRGSPPKLAYGRLLGDDSEVALLHLLHVVLFILFVYPTHVYTQWFWFNDQTKHHV